MEPWKTIEDAKRITEEMPWSEREWPSTFYELLERAAKIWPDGDAVTFQLLSGVNDPSRTLTWSELFARVCQTANLLRELGVGESDSVAMVLPNSIDTLVTYLAGCIAGIITPINPLLSVEQIGAIMHETDAKVLVTLRSMPKSDMAQKTAEALRAAPSVKHVLEIDLRDEMTGIKKQIVRFIRPPVPDRGNVQVHSFSRAIARHPKQLAFKDCGHDRVAAQFHTGGTTGHPKLAQHRYEGLLYNAWLGQELIFAPDDVVCCPLPLFHVFATVVAVGGSLGSGATLYLPTPAGFRGEGVIDNFWKLIERHRVSFTMAVPTAISALMQRKVDADISSLKLAFSGSSPLSVELYKRFEKAAGVTICEGYGLTEATCLVSLNPIGGEKRIGSVGLPAPYCDVRILERESGQDMPAGEVGEICIRSPGVTVKTYIDPAKNASLYWPAPDGGQPFLRTGDLGRLDQDHYLWITGRAKDLIIRGGHNIDPAEIENALSAHPAVAVVSAIGQPDSYAGELPCVYVELVTGADVTEAELMEFSQTHVLERAARPKHLEILKELPKTNVGKIFKPELRAMAIKRVYNDALQDAKLQARVTEVISDKTRGLVARVAHGPAAEDEAVVHLLGTFTRPWEWEQSETPT